MIIVIAMIPPTPAYAKATIKLNRTSVTMQTGKTLTLKATRKGTSKSVTWSSSKKSVATVSKSGKVTAKKAGTAVITAKAGSVKAKCKIKVIKATSISGVVRYYETFYKSDEYGVGGWYTEDDSEPAYLARVYLIPMKTSKLKGTIPLNGITMASKYKKKYQAKAAYFSWTDSMGRFRFDGIPSGKWLVYYRYSKYVVSEQIVLKAGQQWYDSFTINTYNPYLGW